MTEPVKKEGELLDLNVNPCKMCMPLGVSTAAYGIADCMTILHGSQGCATYIRRHMATHYNEPIDIASSSLTEQGAVLGGEKNLRKGIENFIRLYGPRVITVATTCLAETIGEDVPRMLASWHADHPDEDVVLIPVNSPSYAGTHFEGFMRMLHALINAIEMDATPNGRLNVVTGPISPADARYLKYLLDLFEIDYVLLPDMSALDGGRSDVYERLSHDGTRIEDVASMAGATLTIELSTFCPSDYSPAILLEEKYGVPLRRLNLPIGLRDNDALIEVLSEFSGKVIPDTLTQARSRYLDAMIDSHKYNGEGRAAIFGEPDLVYSLVRSACEQGLVPVVAATGAVVDGFAEACDEEIAPLAYAMVVDAYDCIDDADFGDIERLALANGATVLVGSSDGRRIESDHGIPLVRCGFPIHDHIGGQRICMFGYDDSIAFIDRITNTLLQRKVSTFRKRMYDAYCTDQEPEETVVTRGKVDPSAHPCFAAGCSHENARMHLAIAPKCNIQCRYCVREYDCVNESRPGVVSKILSPVQALERFQQAKGEIDNLTVVGVAGPGDALANWEETSETLKLIRQEDPDVMFCLSTNGLLLPRYADALADLGVSHVTITVNAVDPTIGVKVYDWLSLDGVTYRGEAAAGILLSNQIAGLKRLIELGVMVKVNTVLIKDVNDSHVEDISRKLAEWGVEVHNVMPLIPVAGSGFEGHPLTDRHTLNRVRMRCGEHVKQMYHCQQCRADAVGKLAEDISRVFDTLGSDDGLPREHVSVDFATIAAPLEEDDVLPAPIRVAVATRGAMMVDTHFGQAHEFSIYETDGDIARLVEHRQVEKYCSGGQENCDAKDRLSRAISSVSDCQAVLALRIGDAPAKALERKGICVISTCDYVEDAVLDAVSMVVARQGKFEEIKAVS